MGKTKMLKLFIFSLFIASEGIAQLSSEFTVLNASFRKTESLSELLSKTPFEARIVRDENGLLNVVKKTAVIHPYISDHNGMVDPVLQPPLNSENRIEAATATVLQNFDGIGFTAVNPADPVSATGPNHVIQMINAASGAVVKIFDKAGGTVVNSFLLSNITNYQGAGDPIVLYDQIAGRWLLNEFGYSGGVTTYINTLIFAISATDDPTGSWYVYAFADNSFFVDYQKIAIWHNAYFGTSNDFNTTGTSYFGSSIYAFERSKMLNGDPTAVAIRSRLTHSTGRYFSMAPVTQEGPLPSSLSGQFAFYQNDTWTVDPADVDSLYTFEFAPNFTTPASSVISTPTQMAIAAFDDDLCAATRERCIPQQGSAIQLEALTGRIMNKVNFRKFPSYESMVLSATVDANGSGLAGIRWWELRRTSGTWSVFQEGTYAPDANHRFMGSITQDAKGNIGLIYNVSGNAEHPSIRFTARNPCDPLGTMTGTELTIMDGTAANASNRYGDYNSVSIDPSDNLTFWLTGMYNTATSWSTRMASFTLDDCTPSPKVRFQTSAVTVREQDANVSAGCLNYKDYTVNVIIDAAPSADAILTLSTSGTATGNQDFIITPSSVTLNAANLSRPVTVRIFDDGSIEGDESINISFSINNSGGNAVAADYNQTCQIKIVDNDNLPEVSKTTYAAVGFGNVGAITSGPFSGSGSTDKKIQNLYLASELTSMGIAPGFITHFAWRSGSATVATFNNLNVRIGFTGVSTLSGGFVSTTFSNILPTTNFTTPGTTGWMTGWTLPAPVYWNGTDNIVIETCWDNTTTSSDIAVIGTTVSGYIPSALVTQNAAGSVCASAAAGTSTTRPNIRLTMSVPINTVANTLISKVASLGPNDDVPFYDASGRIMARVKNLTNFDYGCTTVEIDRAGTGTSPFWNNNLSNYLTSKSFRIVPTNANPVGQYDITLYYTAAEKAGYETATGLSWNVVQMIKSGGAISSITPATPTASSVIANSAVTHGSFGNDYTVTATFNSGFSGFAIGQAGYILPVSFLSFTGEKNKDVVDLKWITGFEHNNAVFEIETSKDGSNFYRIGSKPSYGNASTDQHYSFTDRMPVTGMNYYRIKQIDIDSRNSYSNTIAVQFEGKNHVLTVYPNPAKDRITISTPQPVHNVTIRIVSADGRIAIAETISSIQRNYELDIQSLAKGIYFIEFFTLTGKNITRFVKE